MLEQERPDMALSVMCAHPMHIRTCNGHFLAQSKDSKGGSYHWSLIVGIMSERSDRSWKRSNNSSQTPIDCTILCTTCTILCTIVVWVTVDILYTRISITLEISQEFLGLGSISIARFCAQLARFCAQLLFRLLSKFCTPEIL